MKITRRFTRPREDVFAGVEWARRTSRITNADGSVVFEMTDAEVPRSWSQLATDIMVSKYFRKAGVPQEDDQGQPIRDEQGRPVTGPERSARQVIHRLAGCWRHWGEQHGYFDSPEDAEAFYDELAYMMLHQMAAPNSPQWFNTGLNRAYGITGPAQGHWIVDPDTGEAQLAEDAYTHPQPHACFIQSVDDDLVNSGGIMDLWTREARLFKYGSGTGTNFSRLRAEDERLSGGGRSSGLMSFLKIGDRAAGAIKSGGTTRRAAKMVCLDADHPDIERFVNWKVREELKVAAMVEGLKHLPAEQRALAEKLDLELTYDFNGEAYATVSGQNSNNSVRLTDEFFRAVEEDGDWALVTRTDGRIARTVKARDLWSQICFAAWQCADPGVQFDTTINAWHTCPASGRINASNPCSEYMFLDDTACNLASINLLRFYDPAGRSFDLDGFEHAIGLWTVVLEISVLMAAFPSKEIAEQSHRYRTLGLGYANLGAMLMQAGIPYDSDAARAVCGAVTAIMCGRAYETSATMARELGTFPGYASNQHAMLRVIRNHRRAAHGVRRDAGEYEKLEIRPVPIDHELFRADRVGIGNARAMLERAAAAWDDALALGEKFGYRNAQVTVIAPTGTIGLLMDCDTTGVEPDFALTKFKKLAGGGYFKIANQSLRPALDALGYNQEQIVDVLTYVMGTLSLDAPMPRSRREETATLREFLRAALRLHRLVDARGRAQGPRRGGPAAGPVRPVLQRAEAPGAHRRGDSRVEPDRLRHADRRGCPPPQDRAPAGLRLCQPVRRDRPALHPGRGPHPHDGRGPAVRERGDLQDHQPARRRDDRRHRHRLPAELGAGAQGQRAVPQRLQAEPAPEHQRRRGQRLAGARPGGSINRSCGTGTCDNDLVDLVRLAPRAAGGDPGADRGADH
jgi:ribonucleoside-diphosphate reductase alpha chain